MGGNASAMREENGQTDRTGRKSMVTQINTLLSKIKKKKKKEEGKKSSISEYTRPNLDVDALQ